MPKKARSKKTEDYIDEEEISAEDGIESDTEPLDRRDMEQRDLRMRRKDTIEKLREKFYGDPVKGPEDADEYMLQARKGGYVKKMAKGGVVMANCGASVPPAQKRK